LHPYPGNPRTFAEEDVFGLAFQKVDEGRAKAESGFKYDFTAVDIQDACDDAVVGLQKASEGMMISGVAAHIEPGSPGGFKRSGERRVNGLSMQA
jgi:hypothetical protein